MSIKAKASIELITAMIFMGSFVVVGKMIVEVFPIYLASGLRLMFALLILLPLLFVVEKGFPKISKNDMWILFVESFTGIFLFSIFLLYGLKYVSAASGGIIISTTPAVIGIIAYLFLKEKLSWKKGAGISIVVIGLISIHVLDHFTGVETSASIWIGTLFMIGAVLGEALMTIFGKVLTSRLSPLAITTWLSIFGFLLFLPFAVYEGITFDFSTVKLTEWLQLFYYGAFISGGVVLLWHQGVSRIPASSAGVYLGILPISSAFLAYVFLKESIFLSQIIGMVFVIVGIMVVTRDSEQPQSIVKDVEV
ncbi:DMT family transporter [Anaerobacillus sp. MEB173]|uniref:DMT family transporter n=1 Tax=Anaerobacillus sp. MEB173 TaxID=3383345 RepID=UPI003F914BA5